MWVLAEAETRYIPAFQIHTGATLPSTSLEENVSKGLAYRVDMDLMEPYQGKGHRLFMDNYYTSVQDLFKKGTFAAGTMRCYHKNFPEELKINKKTRKTSWMLVTFDSQHLKTQLQCCGKTGVTFSS